MAASIPSSRWARPRALALASSVLACLALTGCGPTAAISLQVGTTALVVPLGQTAEVEVTVTRSGGSGSVGLTASGAPAWVDVSFDPASLGAGETTSTMSIATDDPDGEPASFTLTVTATGSGVSAEARIEVDVQAIDVAGAVVDPYGDPLSGYTVYLPGSPPQLTGSDGAFTFDAVTVPYDLTVVAPTVGGQTLAQTFVGLTTGTPSVVPLAAALGQVGDSYSGSATGDLISATYSPLPAEHAARVCLEGVDRRLVYSCGTLTAGDGDYFISGQWFGSPDAQVRVRAVVYHVGADGEPDAIVASGATPTFTLSDTGNQAQDITLTATSSQATATYDLTVPPGLTVTEHVLVAHHSQHASFGLESGDSTATTGTLVAPYFDGIDYSLYAIAYEDPISVERGSLAWATGLAPGAAVSLELPTPPSLVAPSDGAPSVTASTEFTVSNPEGGILSFVAIPGGTGVAFVVTTDQAAVRFPDLTAIGLGPTSGATYLWYVISTPDVGSTDDAVTGDGYLSQFAKLNDATYGGGPGPTTDGRVSTSQQWNFTVQ